MKLNVFSWPVLLTACFAFGLADEEVLNEDIYSEIQSLVGFLDHLSQFYVHGGLLVHLQSQVVDMKDSEEAFKSIEKFVKTLEWQVEALIRESEKKQEEEAPGKILKFFMTRFVVVRDREIKETEKMLVDAFGKLKFSSQKGMKEYITEKGSQKKLLKKLLELGQAANLIEKGDGNKNGTKDENQLGLTFYYAARVFLPFAKAILSAEEMGTGEESYDYNKALELLITESNNLKEIVGMIGKYKTEFEALNSVEGKWKWISNATREMFKGRVFKNIIFSVQKTNSLNAEKDELMKRMEGRLEDFRQRHEDVKNKMYAAEVRLGQVAGSKVKTEL